MEVQLLVLDNCPSCQAAERVWRRAAEVQGLQLAVVNIGEPAGAALSKALKLETLPAVIIDGKLRAVGVQDAGEAAALLADSNLPDTT